MEHRQLQDRDGLGSDPGFCLRPHALYGCRHTGACCTAGWAIPIETTAFERVRVHFGAKDYFTIDPAPPEGTAAILRLRPDGACVFFDAERGRLCAVHRELGEDSLPSACRQYPRVVLNDARGRLISLSHYCPTAAALLLEDHPLDIVPAPPSLSLGGRAEGLDARDVMPPLLRPGMLADVEGYARWERRAIATLASGQLSAARAIATIDAATRAIVSWMPGTDSLAARVDREFDVALAPEPDEDLHADWARVAACLESVPPGLSARPIDGLQERRPPVVQWWPEVDRVARAYLAARLFGNWIAYYGQGLHAIVEYLRVCLAVLKLEAARQQQPASRLTAASTSISPWQTVLEAIRNADLLLVHLADTKSLAHRLS
jgi:Fe-S-cluster containining protein